MTQRKIKFRAWDGDAREMVYSDLELPTSVEIIHSLKLQAKVELIWMQSTGLFDKTGKEIYEDDVLQFVYPKGPEHRKKIVHRHRVFWNEKHGQWWMRGCGALKNMEQSLWARAATHEIVGNAHENPKFI